MISQIRQAKDRLIAKILTRHPALFRAWEKRSQGLVFQDSPWHPLTKPIEDCKVSLVTTGGVHLPTQPAFDMDNPNGDCGYREIPAETNTSNLKITHNYYDHKDADEDVNIVFPIDPLNLLAKSGEIGPVNSRHLSFMGHLQKEQLDCLVKQTAPEVARLLKEDGVDAVILSPA